MKNKIEDNVARKFEKELEAQAELGKMCRSYGVTKSDIFLLNSIKSQRKTEEVQYLLDHNLTIEDLERKEQDKHWDPLTFFGK